MHEAGVPPWAIVAVISVVAICASVVGIIAVISFHLRARQTLAHGGAQYHENDIDLDSSLPLELLQVDAPEGRKLVRSAEVEWFEAAGNYLRLHSNGSSYLYRQSLATLQRLLDERKFLRTHRSVIINLDCVTAVLPKPSGDAEIVLRSGSRVPLSRRFAREFHERTGRGMTGAVDGANTERNPGQTAGTRH